MAMPVGISEWQVREALRPHLGSALVEQTPLARQAASVLRGYAPYRDTLEELEARLESCLFDELYNALGDHMTVRLDDGRIVRIRMRQLPELADEAMGVLFESLQVYSVNYRTLKDYSMRAGSLSAMRVLYEKYAEFQSEEERELLARVIRDRGGAVIRN